MPDATSPKIFLSYSSVDESFVERLYLRLSRDGISCYFAPATIPPGANFVMDLQRALDECNYLVMVLSNAYLESEFAMAEWSAIVANDPANLEGRLIPLLLEECPLPAFVRTLNHLDATNDAAFQRSYTRMRLLFAQSASHDIERRNEEIEALLLRKDEERALKRLLDFMADFAPHRADVNRVVAIVTSLRTLREATDVSLSERLMARTDLLAEALNVKDSVIDQLALIGAAA